MLCPVSGALETVMLLGSFFEVKQSVESVYMRCVLKLVSQTEYRRVKN